MITSHSLTFISNSSSNKSDYLRTNGTIRMSWTNWMNWMKWVSEANELNEVNEVNEVSLTNEFCEMSEQESDFARWVRNKSEWVGWNHFLTTTVTYVAPWTEALAHCQHSGTNHLTSARRLRHVKLLTQRVWKAICVVGKQAKGLLLN